MDNSRVFLIMSGIHVFLLKKKKEVERNEKKKILSNQIWKFCQASNKSCFICICCLLKVLFTASISENTHTHTQCMYKSYLQLLYISLKTVQNIQTFKLSSYQQPQFIFTHNQNYAH